MIKSEFPQSNEPRYAYATYGPIFFDPGVDLSSRLIANDFWDEMDEKHPGLRSATGVYIFVVQPTKRSRLKPWYVGMTDNSFEKRFNQHKSLFGRLSSKKGRVAVFLIGRLKPGTKKLIVGPRTSSSNDVLETMLIERCLDLNKKLFNDAKVKYVKGLLVPGFKGKKVGKPRASAQQLAMMLNKKAYKES